MSNKRESFKSRIGFILVSAGCAIGIGNVWKFPYLVGQNGGGIFVLFYLIFLIIMGVPVLTMELAVGRATRKSAVLAYKKLEPKGSKWHIHGWFAVAGAYLLMMYYTTVSGWMLSYFFKFASGTFDKVSMDNADSVFFDMLGNPAEMMLCMAVTVIVGFLVCSFGIQRGLEKVTTTMMSALLVLIVILAIRSVSLPNAKEGVEFYLIPSIDRVYEAGNGSLMKGFGSVISAAMNQAFFTLSLGVACMEIFGSYMSENFSLVGESVRICALDTFVAIISGLIIFPACFSFNVQPDSGPSLIFMTLPKVFMSMPGGRLWGTLFFMFMSFASFSTVITVFENLLATSIDNFGVTRHKAVIVNCIYILIASIPCVLGYNIWSHVHLIGARDILDSEDFIVSNILLPGGSLIYLLFCVTKWGWGFDNYMKECNKGQGLKLSPMVKPYLRYILPILIFIILVQGLV
ncbi:sodium-dependent transporter [Oribacterium sp. P6A1]|uniref:sodium-dependent transporter n=1 Tax=Oribacterium sp. P6A1 TaxID=1410612 RepID=UPI00055FAB39|nr:sodium-dependent transporter [Oribacterium sp. P6A1]